MAGSRKRRRAASPWAIGLCAVLAALLLVTAALCALLGLRSARQSAQIAALQADNTALQTRLAEAETAAQTAQTAADEALAAAQKAGEERDAALLQAQTAALDITALPAGTVLNADTVDKSDLARYFVSSTIVPGDAVYQRIYGKSYVDNKDIPLGQLRYLKLLHYNFDHEIQVGELIVNAELEADYVGIFRELFENEYEIFSMHLIDNYWTGDGASSDSASIDVNNTSAFCYRRATGSGKLSNHAFGRAIDINPQQNPYVSYSSGKAKWYHTNANDYIARNTGLPHVITHDDLCYKIFKKYGFSWGGDWNNPKDYQHFEKE